jgi:hypothetical protein
MSLIDDLRLTDEEIQASWKEGADIMQIRDVIRRICDAQSSKAIRAIIDMCLAESKGVINPEDEYPSYTAGFKDGMYTVAKRLESYLTKEPTENP